MSARFIDWCAEHFPSPNDALAAFFDDAKTAAATVGATLDSLPSLDRRRHELPNLAGKKDGKQFYRASIDRDPDGTVWPAVTFKSYRGAVAYWKPRDLAWQAFMGDRGSAPANNNRRGDYHAAAAAAIEVAQAKAAEQERQQAAGRDAAAIAAQAAWEAADAAGGHPYLTRKAVAPHGLRVARSDRRARLWNDTAGEWQQAVAVRAGDLLIPMLDATGQLVNVQRIDAAGRKRFVMGGRAHGLHHRIEGGTGRTVLAEGYATGATWHEATGDSVVLAFSAGALPVVASYAGADLVAADNDAKGAGEAAALATGLPYVMPPAPGTDWNDAGAEAVRAAVAGLAAPIFDLWKLPRLDLAETPRAKLLDVLAGQSLPEQAAAAALAVAWRLIVTAPASRAIADICAMIGAAAPAGLMHPHTLAGIGKALADFQARRKARALAPVTIAPETAAAHRHERLDSLPRLTEADYSGVIVLRAPMGSGKTREVGAPFIAWAKQAGLLPLAICHRVSLVHDMAGALGLWPYSALDAMDCAGMMETAWQRRQGRTAAPTEGVAICLPSIKAPACEAFAAAADVVLIDEISQVLRFLQAGEVCTAGGANNEGIYQALRAIVANARCVIVADAGADDRTLRFLESCRPGERFRVIEVDEKPAGFAARFAHGAQTAVRAAVLAETLQEVAAGGKVWVAVESRTLPIALARIFADHGFRAIAITADNKGNAEQAAFLAAPEAESLKYDAVFASPVISSGVSIQHNAAGPHFTLGAFIGAGSKITPADAAQMLRRVRYLRRFGLGVGLNNLPGRQSAEGIERGWLEAAELEGTAARVGDFGVLAAEIRAAEANACADFAAGLWWQLEAAHWQLERWETDAEAEQAELSLASAATDAERAAGIMAAKPLDDAEAKALRGKPARTMAESIRLEAHRIRRGMGIADWEPITASDLDDWDNGAAIARMDRFTAWREGKAARYDDSADNAANRRFFVAQVLAYRLGFEGLDLAKPRMTDPEANAVLDRMVAHRFLLAAVGILPRDWGALEIDRKGQLVPFRRPRNAQKAVGMLLRRMGLERFATMARNVYTSPHSYIKETGELYTRAAPKMGRVYSVTEASMARMVRLAERRNRHRETRKIEAAPPAPANDNARWHEWRRRILVRAPHLTRNEAAQAFFARLEGRPPTHGAKVTGWWLRNVLGDRLTA